MFTKFKKGIAMNQIILSEEYSESKAFELYLKAKELSEHAEQLREKVNFLHKVAQALWENDYLKLPESLMYAVHNYDGLIPTKDHKENMKKIFEQLIADNKAMKNVEAAYWRAWGGFEGRLQ